MKERVTRLAAQLPEKELDAILISSPENRHYLSGFTGSAGYLFITPRRQVLFTDSRYTEQAGNQSLHFEVIQIKPGLDWLVDALKETGVKRVGLESDNMTVASYNRVLDAIKENEELGGTSLIATSGITDELRVFKDKDELAQLQKAIDASDRAMEAVCPTIQAGMTEKEVAWRMEVAMREFGSDSISFNTIVASGLNGAMPHHRADDTVIRDGEPIVIDMGAQVNGYCSDITRTVVVGEPDEMFHKIYNIVLGAQLTAINTVRPGLTGEECDALSRVIIAEAGYGDNFGHSLGHGVGLAVHEIPRVGPNAENELKANMVFTIEPGIYLSGWGGVRIEDIVVLGEDGAAPMSKAGK
ncbi:MAG: Xaa-Pro peptidase family protein [Chloroflexota bacterium]|nr:Xaa-Pro peptidase family protein [Chloroflexota bacterium]